MRIGFAVPTEASGATAARRVAREIFTAWGLDLDNPVVDSAIVILSELITNTHKHARLLSRRADVALWLDDGVLGIAVHDRHPHRPQALLAPHPDGTGGWGLQVVRDLTSEAGGTTAMPADDDGAGKTIEITLPLAGAGRLPA